MIEATASLDVLSPIILAVITARATATYLIGKARWISLATSSNSL
jgi:hypothetical protein